MLIALLVVLLSTTHGIIDTTSVDASDFHHVSHTDVAPSFDIRVKQFASSQLLNIDCSQGCGGVTHFASGCSMIDRTLVILETPNVSVLEDIEWHAKSDVLFSEECKELLRPPIV